MTIEVSDWTAMAIQEYYYKRKEDFAIAVAEVARVKSILAEAENALSACVDSMRKLSNDARTLGITIDDECL